MKHLLSILALCLLASCATPPTHRLSLTVAELERGLVDQLGNPSLADRQYLTVSRHEVELAARIAHRPWVPQVWDCDDQCAAALLELRERWVLAGHRLPPAVGTVVGQQNGTHHRVLWYVGNGGKLHRYDAGALGPANISPPFSDVHDL